jgi:hypothetical protein
MIIASSLSLLIYMIIASPLSTHLNDHRLSSFSIHLYHNPIYSFASLIWAFSLLPLCCYFITLSPFSTYSHDYSVSSLCSLIKFSPFPLPSFVNMTSAPFTPLQWLYSSFFARMTPPSLTLIWMAWGIYGYQNFEQKQLKNGLKVKIFWTHSWQNVL